MYMSPPDSFAKPKEESDQTTEQLKLVSKESNQAHRSCKFKVS